MYCYTYANELNCIFADILLWTKTTMQHPIFIKNIARLSNKDLSSELITQLEHCSKTFYRLNEDTKSLRNQVYNNFNLQNQLKVILDTSLHYNQDFIHTLSQLRDLYEEDELWQELIGHIKEEQIYMKELFANLMYQL